MVKREKVPKRRRSISHGFDFDLDENWSHQDVGSSQSSSLRRRLDSAKRDSVDSEFDTNGDVFKDRDIESETRAVLQDIDKLSKKIESVALRDAYGRELRRQDSLDSSYNQDDTSSSLGNSLNSSPLSTMSKIQFSNASSASSSSRKSSNEILPSQSRHGRSLSSSNSQQPSPTPGHRPRARQLSAGSVFSTGSRSPGMPRKVSNSANMLTTGLAVEKRRKKGSRTDSRGHSPSKY